MARLKKYIQENILSSQEKRNEDLIQENDPWVAYFDINSAKNRKGSNDWRNRWHKSFWMLERISCLPKVAERLWAITFQICDLEGSPEVVAFCAAGGGQFVTQEA